MRGTKAKALRKIAGRIVQARRLRTTTTAGDPGPFRYLTGVRRLYQDAKARSQGAR